MIKNVNYSVINGASDADILPAGSLSINSGNELRMHDGSTAGGNSIGSYTDANVATFLANYTGVINFITSPAGMSGLYTITTVNASVSNTMTVANIHGSGTDPNIYIETQANANSNISTWVFSTDGLLTLPAATPIICGAGNDPSVYVEVASGNTTQQWAFSNTGSITFPDSTVQTTAYNIKSLPPLTPWGQAVVYGSLLFTFDVSTGIPGFGGGANGGSGASTNAIWSAEVFQQAVAANTTVTSSYPIASGQPVPLFNYDSPYALAGSSLAPGDYIVLRVQDISANVAYRATYMGSYNAADEGNETKYGSITVEKLT